MYNYDMCMYMYKYSNNNTYFKDFDVNFVVNK